MCVPPRALDEDEVVRSAYDRSRIPPSMAVVEAIAELLGCEPESLAADGLALGEYVDADALDALSTAESVDSITFDVEASTVRLTDSDVTVWRNDT